MSTPDNITSQPKEAVLRDFERVPYDLSGFSFSVGQIGALQTLARYWIVAGDSIEIDANWVMRLSPLRRPLYVDAKVDTFAFFVPHRHIYGSDWVTFIKSGVDEAVTFGTSTLTPTLSCCAGGFSAGSVLPRTIPYGYMRIYNNYFKDPATADLSDAYLEGLADGTAAASYGIACCNLPRIFNTGISQTIDSSDYRLALTDTNTTVDLLNMSALQGRLRSELERDYFAVRYRDIIGGTFGADADTEVDQRPYLIARESQWLSARDVDGTDQASLGVAAGKGVGIISLRIPRRFFNEHGMLWIMTLVRIPPIWINEVHYLDTKSQPTYLQISGDPNVVSRQTPVELLNSDVFNGGGAVSLGYIPYANWYRESVTFTHPRYSTVTGHPFVDGTPTNRADAVYITPTDYNSIFQSTDLQHWNTQGFIEAHAYRCVPDARNSIFAGTGSAGLV